MLIDFVNVGPGGTFESSGNYATESTQIDTLFQHLCDSSSAKSLVVHFHGGLVKEADGVEVAKKMAPVYKSAGAVPLTFVWETGLIETFRDNVLNIHDTDLYQKLLKWLLRRVAQRFGGFEGRGAGVSIPMAQIELELARLEPFASYDDPATGKGAAARGSVAVVEADLDTLKSELQVEFQEDIDGDETVAVQVEALAGRTVDAQSKGLIEGLKLAKLLAAVAYRVIRRHIRGRDHGFYPTVVEELLREFYLADLGAWVWGRMKEKATAMWLPNDGLQGDERRVGSYVLEKMAALQEARPDFRIDLVGHSAGSIAICELLRAAAKRGLALRVNTIAFLAPAGRSELGVEELARHPERYKEFRCYTMADNYEREDQLVPKVYTRSLLYFVSGVLEPDEVDAPIMGMMRHASGQGMFASGAAAEWAAFMRAQQRLVLSDSTKLDPDATVGRRTASHSHGGFDDDGPTRESLTELLRV
jgi:pimeloyl-ACP methyl ester carboxylesterase